MASGLYDDFDYFRDYDEFLKLVKTAVILQQLRRRVHEGTLCQLSHELYARADAFVMTSIQEGQPVSAMEAGCCGLPIFSTMCGGVEDYVTGDIGRIYPIMDFDGFAQGLKDFLEGKVVFDNAHIRNAVVEKYGKHAFANRFTNYMEAVIHNSK